MKKVEIRLTYQCAEPDSGRSVQIYDSISSDPADLDQLKVRLRWLSERFAGVIDDLYNTRRG